MPVASKTILPELAFLRLWHIIGDSKRGIQPLIPVSRTSFYNGMKTGKYPKPVKLGPRTTAWRIEDIRALLEKINTSNAA